jgi:hypothetical protein
MGRGVIVVGGFMSKAQLRVLAARVVLVLGWAVSVHAQGVRPVQDIFPGGGSSSPVPLTDVNGTLFFSADDGVRREPRDPLSTASLHPTT